MRRVKEKNEIRAEGVIGHENSRESLSTHSTAGPLVIFIGLAEPFLE